MNDLPKKPIVLVGASILAALTLWLLGWLFPLLSLLLTLALVASLIGFFGVFAKTAYYAYTRPKTDDDSISKFATGLPKVDLVAIAGFFLAAILCALILGLLPNHENSTATSASQLSAEIAVVNDAGVLLKMELLLQHRWNTKRPFPNRSPRWSFGK